MSSKLGELTKYCCIGKSTSLKAWTGPKDSRKLRFWDFGKVVSKVVNPTFRPPLPPCEYSWHSFLSKPESTPGTQCGRKDYVNKKSRHLPGSNPGPLELVAPPRVPYINVSLPIIFEKYIPFEYLPIHHSMLSHSTLRPCCCLRFPVMLPV
jgi:hypothetical protein